MKNLLKKILFRLHKPLMSIKNKDDIVCLICIILAVLAFFLGFIILIVTMFQAFFWRTVLHLAFVALLIGLAFNLIKFTER